jgi:hypothetical protein
LVFRSIDGIGAVAQSIGAFPLTSRQDIAIFQK